MEVEVELGYFSKDVAIELEVTTSTLRRWSIALEKKGYIFDRNEKDQRVYYQRDFKRFMELKHLLSNFVPFENAVKIVATMDFEDKNIEKTPSVRNEIVRLSKDDLQNLIHSVLEKEREIILAAIDEKFTSKIEQRDRELVRQMQETLNEKKLEIQHSKKGFFKRLFSR